MRYLLGKKALLEGNRRAAEATPRLRLALVQQRANSSQRGPGADWIDAAPQPGTDVPARHPFRHRGQLSIEVDFEEQQAAISQPLGNLELTPKERVKRVLDRYDTLVAGIIH